MNYIDLGLACGQSLFLVEVPLRDGSRLWPGTVTWEDPRASAPKGVSPTALSVLLCEDWEVVMWRSS
jgi:hypothetical protein